MSREERDREKKRRGISPWKRALLRFCVVLLLIAGLLHGFRWWKGRGFIDQQEASRWASEGSYAQVSAYLADQSAMKEEEIRELEYTITQNLAQDSIELTADSEDAKLWEDCYSAQGTLDIEYEGEKMEVSAVGTGGEYFLFHPLTMLSGAVYEDDSLMKDEVLIDEETAWRLFGSYEVVGRTIWVGDMAHTISGVFRKEGGTLSEKAGEPDYLIYVHYKTLLQYDTSGSSGSSEETGNEISAAPSLKSESGSEVYAAALLQSQAAEGSKVPRTATTAAEGSTAAEAAEEDPVGSESSVSSALDNASTGEEELPEGTGTSNTVVEDTGRITEYQIVMPNPVEGYAAQMLEKALGENRIFKVVDNTNRYSERALLSLLTEYGTRSMHLQAIRYPYWENVAVGWEDIFLLLFVLEWLLYFLIILLLLIMAIHYVRHKTWTIAGNFHSMQDAVYEKQSRRRYPEYYREKEMEEMPEEEESDSGEYSLEQKEQMSFRSLRGKRKAEVYEKAEKMDQPAGSGDTAVDNGMRERDEQQ